MTVRRRRLAFVLAASALVAGGLALAHPIRIKEPMRRPAFFPPPQFSLAGKALGGDRPARATSAFLAGSRIAAVGSGALVIDADSGQLVLADAAGAARARLAIGRDAGLLAYDPAARRAYVADRGGDRVAIVDVTDKLALAGELATPAEPYGIALTPDRATVLVATIADRTLVAYDAKTREERWRAALDREPRGIAVSPDGSRALVAYVATGTVDQIDLATRAVEHIPLAPGFTARGERVPAFVRAAFAVAFVGDHEAVVPFQRETPVQIATVESTGSYGGGGSSDPPITHHLAFLAPDGARTQQVTAQIAQHQPRALAWDGAHDELYVAGLRNNTILQLKDASRRTIAFGSSVEIGGAQPCGADGLAIAPDGNVLVWCAFTRSIARYDVTAQTVAAGPVVAESALAADEHRGMVLFHTTQAAISKHGMLACSSCHPDGRADGLSWRIDKGELQTPLLAGRVAGTQPYKWDGGDADLRTSLKTTTTRLGGFGLADDQTAALAAYVEHLPRPRAPTRDAAAVARGKKLFDASGCSSCHEGPASYTDQQRHAFAHSTLPEADTPSLIGLAASAPYYHDGSADTLEAVLRDRGSVHGMADTAKLPDRDLADLTAFLETL